MKNAVYYLVLHFFTLGEQEEEMYYALKTNKQKKPQISKKDLRDFI